MTNLTEFGTENISIFYDPSSADYTSNTAVLVVFCILYAMIFVLGIFGNTLVCYVVIRNRQMQTVTNLFITNLALSDILLCLLAVPLTPLYTFLGRWVFGKTLCHLVPYAQAVSVYLSTMTLTGIAVDRFFVIIHPFQPRIKIEVCVGIIASIWIVALLLTVPYGLYMHIGKLPVNATRSLEYCEESWPSKPFREVFGCLTTILQFIVPFFVIAYCYTRISVRLNDRAKIKPGSKTSEREEADKERKRRTNRMLIAMVAIFGCSWLPLNIFNVTNDFYGAVINWAYYRLCFFVTHCIAMSSTCYNPLLYAWLNDNFRKEFKQVLPCLIGSSTQRDTTDMDERRTKRTCNGNDTIQQESLITVRNLLPQMSRSCELATSEVSMNVTEPREIKVLLCYEQELREQAL